MDWKEIIVHCSDTPDRPNVSWDDIKRYHTEDLGWQDIGYHYGIEMIGGDYALVVGRPHSMVGAHCRWRNSVALGLCIVGEYDTLPPSPLLWEITVETLAHLCQAFDIDPHNVKGHREYDDGKTCPGIKWDLVKLRSDLNKRFLYGGEIDRALILGG